MKTLFCAFLFFIGLSFLAPSQVLAQTAKRIEVDLTNQRLYAFEGERKVFNFVISSGKPWWPTPRGEFSPWIKLSKTRMQGGSKKDGTYYNLPNVPYVMYFSNSQVAKNRGFAIHGTYWHNNFGRPMSHGCVNLKTPDAAKIYNWVNLANPPKIIIYGNTPR